MCDSDSEEFASADEDFEDVESDESERPKDAAPVLPSKQPAVKNSDVDQETRGPVLKDDMKSSKKDTKTSQAVVDGEKQDKERSGELQDEPGVTTQKDISPTKPQDAPPKKQSQQAAEYILPTEQTNLEDGEPKEQQKPVELPREDPVAAKEKVAPKPDEVKSAEAKSAILKSANPLDKASDRVDSVKPRILKPPKPQMILEESRKEPEKPIEPLKPTKSTKEPPSGPAAEEGWDDFDDDWGDFTVDSAGASGPKASQPSGKQERQSKEPPTVVKTSFRDVDIDEVESKLSDFMKHRDDPPIASVLDRVAAAGDSSGGGGGGGQSWGGWKPSWGGAAVSFLSSASKSVASITTNITQVIESGIGVPNPEDLARRQAEEKAKLRADGYLSEEKPSEERPNQTEDRFRFDQLVSGVTQISSKVITGGLDTLEGIGKKTMTILQENDPGLLNKRKLLGLTPNDGVILSQVLREAKAKTEERERNLKQIQKHQYKKKLHFETLFDDYHGLVHLEALEMLSKQAQLKLEALMAPLAGKALEELQETMSEVKELCELPEMESETADADGTQTVDELEQKLRETITDLDPSVKVDFGEIIKSWSEYTAWLDESNRAGAELRSTQDIFEKAMHALAQTTALCVLRMHKLAEILLISEHHSTATEADVLVQLTTVFCWHLSGVAARFCTELTNHNKDNSSPAADESDGSTLITNIFLEGSNSTSYIQNAFQLFIPILQLGAA
ncbi:protein FAM114A2-like [Anopheles albimanus]|uniref:Protein FAM114A2 n=1 Tax=Anopheles albimanus TaxID=7167 RepID=A0A182FSE3_ANOAL|nr:protein FAM114A2-like [Anopheles albimanus]